MAPSTIEAYVAAMRPIPAGRFRMGNDRPPAPRTTPGMHASEAPAHPVAVSALRMGATPVTVGLWRAYLSDNPELRMPAAPDWGWVETHPMVRVRWDEAVAFAKWASRRTGTDLRLPTEAEWEWCARSGGGDARFPWGANFTPARLWCSARRVGDAGRTAAVDRLDRRHRNRWGVSDLAGNVAQWCADWHGPYPDSRSTTQDPRGPGTGRFRVMRGGSWALWDPLHFRCTARTWFVPGDADTTIGFRLAAPGRADGML